MMKKFLLSLTIVLLTFHFANAQQPLSLIWEGNTIGDTVTVWGEPANPNLLIFNAILKNNTDRNMNIKVARNDIFIYDDDPSDTDTPFNYFCWGGLCYSPATDVSVNYQLLPAGASSADYDFSADYSPSNVIGTSTVEYNFYNIDNPDENVKVVVKYWASPQNIAEDAMRGGKISDIYPNPANNFVNLDFELTTAVKQAKVRIINLLGSIVKEVEIETGTNQLKLDVSDLDNGVYFYSVLINGDTYKTKKLIIR